MERRRWLADLLAVAAGELLADVWITFHCRGITSSVSVTSSPSLAQPRAAAAAAGCWPRHDHALARQMVGNGLRAGRLRVKATRLCRLGRGPLGGELVLAGRASSSSSCSSICSSSRAVRSDRGPYSSRRSFSISSFMWAIKAVALDASALACASSASRASSRRFRLSTSSGRQLIGAQHRHGITKRGARANLRSAPIYNPAFSRPLAAATCSRQPPSMPSSR